MQVANNTSFSAQNDKFTRDEGWNLRAINQNAIGIKGSNYFDKLFRKHALIFYESFNLDFVYDS